MISGIVRHSRRLPAGFVADLLRVRLDMAPSYTRLAVASSGRAVLDLLAGWEALPDSAAAYAAFDWALQRGLTVASGNPVYALILNGFAGFYETLAQTYFSRAEARRSSRAYYAALAGAAARGDAAAAESVTRAVMQASINLWQAVAGEDES